MYASAIRVRARHPRPEIEKLALITFYRSVQMCTRPPSAFRFLHPRPLLNRSRIGFLREADGKNANINAKDRNS